MISTILIIVAGLVVAFLVAAALQPGELRVTRNISIATPASVPFARINDLRRWQEISPYAKMDPNARYTFGGPSSGPGATLSWIGNNQIGEGRMTIIESHPSERVRMKLEFIKPFASRGVAEFTFRPERDGTNVTWSMIGPRSYLSKLAGLIMNLDKMIGGQFEEGLANLKRVSEASSVENMKRSPMADLADLRSSS
jgi:hypothetical protein